MGQGDQLNHEQRPSGDGGIRTGADPLRPLFLWTTMSLAVLAAMALLVHMPPGDTRSPMMLAKWFAAKQDIPVIAGFILFCNLLGSQSRALGSGGAKKGLWTLTAKQIVLLLTGLAGLIWLLRAGILFDYDLSRDEKMVTFDAAIFARGQLFAPIPRAWHDAYQALNTLYTLPVGDREGWVSGYLPVNAALRALLGKAIPASLVSPLLVLSGGLALWRITLRLWPDSPSTRTVVLLLFAGSSQVVLMGTTTYAMTAHLAFNLVWLWLFLQGRSATHGAAILLGFFATGLHQPLFHPLFVLPFLDLLRRERQWRTLAAYLAGYGLIGLFWLAWPHWISAQGLHPVPAQFDQGGIGFFQRLLRGAIPLSPLSFWLMGANLLRFFAWQHLLLLPLILAALRSGAKADPVCRALLLGMALLITIMTLIMPMQVHGWGYRYLHGFIGSAVLIAGFGWHRLERDGLAPVRAWRWATALSLLVLLPVHVWMARTMTEPFARTSARLQALPADLVVVDDGSAAFSLDLVLNRADLTNRPILLSSSRLQPDVLARLCAGKSLAFAETGMLAALDRTFGQESHAGPSPRMQRLEQAARSAGCRMTVIAQ